MSGIDSNLRQKEVHEVEDVEIHNVKLEYVLYLYHFRRQRLYILAKIAKSRFVSLDKVTLSLQQSTADQILSFRFENRISAALKPKESAIVCW
jgi:hypothetical protein